MTYVMFRRIKTDDFNYVKWGAMGITKFLLTNAVLLCLIWQAPQIARADFICRTEVAYRWKRSESAPAKPESDETPAASPSSSEGEASPQEVFWRAVETSGAEEEAVRAKLTEAANQEKLPALEACRREHQNLSGCIASKYQGLAGSFTSLGFSARKALEEAVIQDCTKQQGECLEAVAKEIKCVEKKEEAPPPDDKAAKDGGKEKGKKK
ncbi:MAG: hypothetical protein J5J00_01325 [Deltaproteobacteria bacterium]|nr:hypothetical protein [Deltaproteobacteria bacterium]